METANKVGMLRRVSSVGRASFERSRCKSTDETWVQTQAAVVGKNLAVPSGVKMELIARIEKM